MMQESQVQSLRAGEPVGDEKADSLIKVFTAYFLNYAQTDIDLPARRQAA